MTEHTPTPWRVEQDTDLIWGACNPDDQSSYGMGYAIVEGKSGEKYSGYKPEMDERWANAAFIVKAVNNLDALVAMLEKILRANHDFVNAMPTGYEGDSLTDACDEARVLLAAVSTPRGVE